jgi:hypothetical protein
MSHSYTKVRYGVPQSTIVDALTRSVRRNGRPAESDSRSSPTLKEDSPQLVGRRSVRPFWMVLKSDITQVGGL